MLEKSFITPLIIPPFKKVIIWWASKVYKRFIISLSYPLRPLTLPPPPFPPISLFTSPLSLSLHPPPYSLSLILSSLSIRFCPKGLSTWGNSSRIQSEMNHIWLSYFWKYRSVLIDFYSNFYICNCIISMVHSDILVASCINITSRLQT